MRNFGQYGSIRDRLRSRGGAGPQQGGANRDGSRASRSGGLMKDIVRRQGVRTQLLDLESRVGGVEAQVEESFLSRFRIPLILGGALLGAGSIYYFGWVRPQKKAGLRVVSTKGQKRLTAKA